MIKQYAVLNDIHFPYENKVAYKKALDIMKALPNLEHIYLNGDIGEIESVSKYTRSPQAANILKNEIDYINNKLMELETMFPNVPVTYIEGNHEHRVHTFILNIAPQFWGMNSIEELFHFDKRPHWKFIPYTNSQWVRCGKTNDLYLRHVPLGTGQNHSKGTAEKIYVSLLYGHTHGYQQYTHKIHGPRPYTVTATSNGWLGDITKDCFNYRGVKDVWVNGFSIVECDEETGKYEIKFIRL